MSTATKSKAMNSDKDKFINKDNDVVLINDTTVVRSPNPNHNLNPKQTENERRQTAEKRQEKGQTGKEMKAFFAKKLEDEIAQYSASEGEESSQISDFEMSDPLQSDPLQLSELLTASKMAELITVTIMKSIKCVVRLLQFLSVLKAIKKQEKLLMIFLSQISNW